MDLETRDKPAVRRTRDVQRERVAALLAEQRLREERVGLRRRVRRGAGWPEGRAEADEPWGPRPAGLKPEGVPVLVPEAWFSPAPASA